MLKSMVGETIGGATVLELVLAFATGFAFYSMVAAASNRYALSNQGFEAPLRVWLVPALVPFLVCAALLIAAMYLRVRMLGGIEEEARV